jgi:hypothetical protein
VFDSQPYKAEVQSFVTKKQVTPTFHMIFLRGIGCNWLVCLACYLGIQGRDVASKIIGIWFPIYGFVSLSFDHVVANMFFIPMGIWEDTPHVTVGLYIWKGIIPAGLGNIIGGGLFCGVYYWWMYVFMEPEISVDGIEYQRTENLNGMALPFHFGKAKRDEEHSPSGKSEDGQHEVTGIARTGDQLGG